MGILLENLPARKAQTGDQFSQQLLLMILSVENEWARVMATSKRGSVDTTRQSLLRMAHHSLATLNEMDNTGEREAGSRHA